MRTLERGVAASPVLSALGINVRAARGRFYLERHGQDESCGPFTVVWGRITPLAAAEKELLLEAERRNGSWSEVATGSAQAHQARRQRQKRDLPRAGLPGCQPS